ncbi:MAG TPA: dTDP-4-dehydrorhamnose 3,5-epimerase [Solirubrobacteraceae bacterium]|jgi:dTDP-4-dehydrorhamnose 3,5-epimerase|nr:dTDP-4-dehydrorhamnose 3,5-epimerase [Solirubrobacteraceae bacterium]
MRFEQTPLAGAWVVELEVIGDGRGSFARTFDADEFRERGMDSTVVQCNTSYNAHAGTLRGMHFQAEPHGEPKLIRCVRGAIFDVGIDLRPDSASYRRWHGVELSAENHRMLFLPRGFAHGYQTLADDCEILYQMGERYVPEAGRGVRWDDPAFAIDWPPATGGRVISERDRSYPDFRP